MLILPGADNTEQEILIDLRIIELEEASVTAFDLHKLPERFMELIVRTLEQEIPAVRDIAFVDEMLLEHKACGTEPFHRLLVAKRGNDLFVM